MAADNLTHKGYTGSVEPSIEDECLHGRVLFIEDMVTYEGKTIPELIQSFKDAVDRYLAYCERTGKEACKVYSGTFNVRIGPDLHKKAVHAAAKHGIKLNEFVVQAVSAAVNQDGPTKIEPFHQINLTIAGVTNPETRVATAGIAPIWEEPTHAAVH